MDIAEIRKAVAADPDLLKSLADFVGEKDRAANLTKELEQLKADFAQETEEMAKSLTETEEILDRSEQARKFAERAVGEVLLRQEALAKCLVEAVGPAVQAQADRLDALHELVKALGDRPAPARAVTVVPTPEETRPDAGEAPVVDYDPAEILSKAMDFDKRQGKKDFPTWKALRRASNADEFRAIAQKENLL